MPADEPNLPPAAVTQILHDLRNDRPGASERLLPLVYEELRRLAHGYMASEPAAQTLQATALVHEAYMRLVGSDNPSWSSRGHFFGAAAQAMRRILVDRARERAALKRGGDRDRMPLSDSVVGTELGPVDDDALLRLDEALNSFAREYPRKAEVVMLRYFAGLTNDEAARCLGVSDATVRNDWTFARAWLFRAMTPQE